MESTLLDEAAADVTMESRLDSIMDKLGPDEGEGAANATPAPATEQTDAPATAAGDEGQPETAVTQGEDGKVDPAPLVIEAPDSWKADYKARFAEIPEELRSYILERDRESKAATNRNLNEAAEKSKAAEQERQRHAQAADQFLNLASTLDPILADGQKTDWAALARENPAEYVQKWAAYQQRVGHVQSALQQREQAQAQTRQQHFAREEAALLEKVPEWRDPQKGKAAMDEIRNAAVDHYGFTPEQIKAIPDHRQVLVLRDALAFRKLQAAQKSAAAKQVVTVPKVQRPGPGASANDAAKASMQRVRNATSLESKAEAIAALIGDE